MAKYCKNYQCPVNQINSDYCLFCKNVTVQKHNEILEKRIEEYR